MGTEFFKQMGMCKSSEVEKCIIGIEGKLDRRMILSENRDILKELILAVSHKQDDHTSGLPWEALLI